MDPYTIDTVKDRYGDDCSRFYQQQTDMDGGGRDEISSLRAEYGGAVGNLLVLYVIQIYLGLGDMVQHVVEMFIDNGEVLVRVNEPSIGRILQDLMVSDYDPWRVVIIL